jgi:3-oxoacyl-[acyl-carrier protein] reductase
MNLSGKKIIVTGGSLGIGKQTAKELVLRGAEVVITGRSEERLRIAADYCKAKWVVFDIADLEHIPSNSKKCLELLGGQVDVVINNAGVGAFKPIEDVSLSDFQTQFNTNVFGLALFTKEIVPIMKAQNKGNIVNIGTTASLKGFKNGSVYAASKFAVRALSQCWQAELRPYNIRVYQLNPSEVTTAFYNTNSIEPKEVDNKLSSHEIAHSIVSILEMNDKGFVNELSVWATNPF